MTRKKAGEALPQASPSDHVSSPHAATSSPTGEAGDRAAQRNRCRNSIPDLRSLFLFTIVPERRLNTEFIIHLDGNADIVAQHFTKQFVNLCSLRSTANPLAELCLDHCVRALRVAAHMVHSNEIHFVQGVEVVQTCPQWITAAVNGISIRFERDHRQCALALSVLQVRKARIRFVTHHFSYPKILGCHVKQWFKIRSVASIRDFCLKNGICSRCEPGFESFGGLVPSHHLIPIGHQSSCMSIFESIDQVLADFDRKAMPAKRGTDRHQTTVLVSVV